ncbi:hypothetical protein HDU98_011156 [Podochytrium sp. JEL0797]|nr:hypothetical protein HDU98_011156 [Podochytrium sp. JEL0797]
MGNLCCPCLAEPPIDFDQPVDITHFSLCRSIGRGAFGKVRIVEHKLTKVSYALKYIDKQACAKQGLANNMLRERRLLEECHSPWVCNLRYAFQDDMHILMVLDLKLGGDLDWHLRISPTGFFPEDRAKFYFAEIVCGLSYLHSLKICHRDIKPGNVLLDEFGHASLTDFNIACHYDASKPMSSRSGTMSYMGIMTFEMLYGYTPFTHTHDTDTTHAIRHDPLKFPGTTKAEVSDLAKSILEGLIERDVNLRLGSQENGGDCKIREHKWFGPEWSWDKIEAREVPVPFLPDAVKNMYYNPLLELEEALFEDNPLQNRPVKKKQPKEVSNLALGDKVEESDEAQQLRQLTEGFAHFDFSKVNMPAQSIEMVASVDNSFEQLVKKPQE